MSSGDGQINDTISITAHAEVTKELDASQNWQVVNETTTWQIQGHGSMSPALPGLINSWTYTKVEEAFSASFAVDLDARHRRGDRRSAFLRAGTVPGGLGCDPLPQTRLGPVRAKRHRPHTPFHRALPDFLRKRAGHGDVPTGWRGAAAHFQATYRVSFNAREVEAG